MGEHRAPELAAEIASARVARVWLDGVFAVEQVEGDGCDVCLLLLDELVANAVVHGGSTVQVSVDIGAEVRIEVTNHGTHGDVEAIPYEQGRPAQHFGLHLVHGLSTNWGVTREDGDTTVWFEVPHPGTAPAPGEMTAIGRPTAVPEPREAGASELVDLTAAEREEAQAWLESEPRPD